MAALLLSEINNLTEKHLELYLPTNLIKKNFGYRKISMHRKLMACCHVMVSLFSKYTVHLKIFI